MYKKAIFLGECMVELNGDISSLGIKSSNMKVNFGGDTYNSAVYFSRLVNNKINTYYSTALGNDNFCFSGCSTLGNEKMMLSNVTTPENKNKRVFPNVSTPGDEQKELLSVFVIRRD